MIKVFQIADQTSMFPASSFMYGLTNVFDPIANLDRYTHVADLDVNDLDEAYRVGNIGPEELYTRYESMHSVSVGDILETEDGEKWIVGPMGFDRLASLEAA